MADRDAEVEALVLGAGRGERLGLGPKALLRLGGETLVDRAIAVVRTVAARVIAGVPEDCLDAVRVPPEGDVLLLAGGATRLDTAMRLFAASRAPLILQHDVVHPFVTPELCRRVLAAARAHGAAMAAARVAEHVYRGGERAVERLASPEGLWLARKPLAFSRAAFARAVARGAPDPGGDPGTAEVLLAAGQPIALVPVEPWNVKITTREDWALAQGLERLLAGGGLRRGAG